MTKNYILCVAFLIIGLIHADEDIVNNNINYFNKSNMVINVDEDSDMTKMFSGDMDLSSCLYANPNGVTRYIQFSNSVATTFTSWTFSYYSNNSCGGTLRQRITYNNSSNISTPAGTYVPCDVNNNFFKQTNGNNSQSVQVTWNWPGGTRSNCYNNRVFTNTAGGSCTASDCSFNAGSTTVFSVR